MLRTNGTNVPIKSLNDEEQSSYHLLVYNMDNMMHADVDGPITFKIRGLDDHIPS